MPYSTTGKNIMLDSLLVTHASLHTADPGNTGANEVTGGSPAYARKAITMAAASGGTRTASDTPVFDVPGGGTTVTHVGFWTAATAGTFLGSDDLAASETFASQGQFTITSSSLSIT